MGVVPFSALIPELVTIQPFNQFSEITQFVTTNKFGVSSVDFSGITIHPKNEKETALSKANINWVCDMLHIAENRLVLPDQTHSNNVKIMDEKFTMMALKNQEKYVQNCDGLVTDCKSLFLGILTADCLPIVFYDPLKKVIGIAHAGWQGTANGICLEVIDKMVGVYQANPQNLIVGVGPSISVNNYEVGSDFIDNFSGIIPQNMLETAIKIRNEKVLFDLYKVNEYQLLYKGVKHENIHNSNVCSFDSTAFFSYRKSPKQNGRMLTAIAINA